jgi:hypothetical protein
MLRDYGGDPRTGVRRGARSRQAHTEQPIDTGTAAGKCFLDMLGVFAEFETSLRRERQLEGIAKAKAAGVYKGRPPSIEASLVRELKAQGMRPVDIAKALKIGPISPSEMATISTPPIRMRCLAAMRGPDQLPDQSKSRSRIPRHGCSGCGAHYQHACGAMTFKFSPEGNTIAARNLLRPRASQRSRFSGLSS